MGKSHKLYTIFKEAYESRLSDTKDKQFKNFKHSVDLNPGLSSGIAGKIWVDEYVVFEGETYPSPITNICPNINDNHVLSMHYHDPVYETEYVFKANVLEGAV